MGLVKGYVGQLVNQPIYHVLKTVEEQQMTIK